MRRAHRVYVVALKSTGVDDNVFRARRFFQMLARAGYTCVTLVDEPEQVWEPGPSSPALRELICPIEVAQLAEECHVLVTDDIRDVHHQRAAKENRAQEAARAQAQHHAYAQRLQPTYEL